MEPGLPNVNGRLKIVVYFRIFLDSEIPIKDFTMHKSEYIWQSMRGTLYFEAKNAIHT